MVEKRAFFLTLLTAAHHNNVCNVQVIGVSEKAHNSCLSLEFLALTYPLKSWQAQLSLQNRKWRRMDEWCQSELVKPSKKYPFKVSVCINAN